MTHKILIADDEPNIVISLEYLLQREGYAVLVARDGQEALEKAISFGFPVILKAAAGGGGRGMRLCEMPEDVIPAFELVKSEARKAFGNDDIFIEKYLVQPKHIEVQILADGQGDVHPVQPGHCHVFPGNHMWL